MGGPADMPGSTGYQILLHELGHALGLKHPHDTFIARLPTDDNTELTVMSYTWQGGNKTEYQEDDVAALQWIYGGDGLGGAGARASGEPMMLGTDAGDSMLGGAGHDYMIVAF